MISVLWLPIGLVPMTLIGWLMLRILEGSAPVLRSVERWVMGSVLGLTISLFAVFVLHVGLGLPFSRWGFLGAFGLLLFLLGGTWFWQRGYMMSHARTVALPAGTMPRWAAITLGIVGAWALLKILALGFLLVATPTYFDDSTDNWNMRGKLFFAHQELRLVIPPDTGPTGVSSYPPTVSLSKTWLASLAGAWHEPLINAIHGVWYLTALLLVYLFLRRRMTRGWALVGTYILASLPLYLVQGMNAYGDVFVSLHVCMALFLLFHALESSDGPAARSWLRLATFAIALLPFTKNEALLLYLPPMLLVLALSLWRLRARGMLTNRDAMSVLLLLGIFLVLILGPWLGYKWANGLPFGNAKSLDSFGFAWQPGVVMAVVVNTFFEGNWLLLFPLFFGLLAMRLRTSLSGSLAVLTLFFAILYVGQLFLFLFTGLSAEALQQTGYARGLIHLLPVAVALTTLLLEDVFGSTLDEPRREILTHG